LFFAVRLVPYRWKRIISFVDPFSDPYGKGYQILQSLKAFNKGGVWGVGPGNGSLKQGYLPEPYGDFIFAAIGEEIGLIGTLLIVGLYILFGYVGIRIGRQAPDKFSELLAYALVIVIVIQAFFNMAVTLGVVPTTGLTLPFISKGGSSLMVFMTICGILFNINKQPPLNKSIWEKGYVTST
jgi:cell division protein FtsW